MKIHAAFTQNQIDRCFVWLHPITAKSATRIYHPKKSNKQRERGAIFSMQRRSKGDI